jgi:sugar O-acyltransferase (sialic acid O-acetyltransferase NeuD family)
VDKLIVIGAGGLGQEVLWAARRLNAYRPVFDIVGFCDDDPTKSGQLWLGYRVLGTPEEVAAAGLTSVVFVCGIGSNGTREAVVGRAHTLGWTPGVVVDPSVIVADGAAVGPGTYIGAGSILSPNAKVGAHVIVNHHCSIGHDSVLEDFVQISPGSRVSGASVIARGAFLGSNAVVAPMRRVGRNAVLAAGSFAMKDVPDGTTAIGVPARTTIRRDV